MKWFMQWFGSFADRAIRYMKVREINAYHRYPGIHERVNFCTNGSEPFRIADPEHCTIGKGCVFICQNSYLGCKGGLEIGNFCHFARGLSIFTYNHQINGETLPYDPPYENADIHKKVVIGDYVWCGANVCICPGVTIGEGAVIGLGAVVTKDVPPLAVVGGNPAKVLKYRDRDIYEANKAGQHTWGWRKRQARAEAETAKCGE